MDLSTSLVGGIILLAMLAPVAYMIMNASGSDGKAKKALSKLASSNNVELKDIEVHGNLVVGINEHSKNLAYSYKNDVASNFKNVDLSKIRQSQIKTTKIDDKSLETVKLELSGNGENFFLTFYDDHDETNQSLDPHIALQNARNLDSRIRILL